MQLQLRSRPGLTFSCSNVMQWLRQVVRKHAFNKHLMTSASPRSDVTEVQ